MRIRRILPSVLRSVALPAFLFAALAAAQTRPAAPVPLPVPTSAVSDRDLAATRHELL